MKYRINSNNIDFIDEFNINENQDEYSKKKVFIRASSKKAATVGESLQKLNNLEIKIFNYQEEQNENNYITKIRQSKHFINYIDIDLFLQYIALGKNFYENEDENNNLKEGFCLQYQTFIFPETLINKIISCFNYFYSEYLNKDNNEKKIITRENIEKPKNENDKSDDNDNNNEDDNNENNIDNDRDTNINQQNFVYHRRNAFKLRKSSNTSDNNSKKIPYGLIDFIYSFIRMHIIYNHNELSQEVINKINNFLKQLKDIKEIKDIYKQKIELYEMTLKEYENLKKKFGPISPNNHEREMDKLSSSEEFNSEEEEEKEGEKNKEKEFKKKKNEKNRKNLIKDEKDIKEKNEKINKSDKKDIKKKLFSKDKQIIKMKSSKELTQGKFIEIYEDDFSTKSLNFINIWNKKEEKLKNKENEKLKKVEPYEFDILKYKTLDIASELARVNYALFSKIEVKEFLKGAFNSKDKYRLSPNICQIAKRFNTLSSWVIEEILSYDHAEKRAQILLKFIQICVELKKIGDFADCLSILAGLCNYNIKRLSKTWGHIHSADMANFRGLNIMLSIEDNWKNLRNEIEKRIEDKSFFIPYLGYYTKRLIFLEEMGPYIKKNSSLINIEKIVEVYKTLKDFYQIKRIEYCGYNCTDDIKKDLLVLQCLEASNDDFLAQVSNVLEPKFILSTKKMNIKRRTKTDIYFLNNIKNIDLL